MIAVSLEMSDEPYLFAALLFAYTVKSQLGSGSESQRNHLKGI